MAANRTTEPEGWRERFLDALRDQRGNVRRACEAAGIARSWAYELREKDATFAAEWKQAALDAADLIEEKLLSRGLEGWEEPVYQGGQLVGTVTRFAHNIAMQILKAGNPEKYGDRTELRHSGPDGGPIQIQQQTDLSRLTDEQLAQLAQILDAAQPAGDPPGDRA